MLKLDDYALTGSKTANIHFINMVNQKANRCLLIKCSGFPLLILSLTYLTAGLKGKMKPPHQSIKEEPSLADTKFGLWS